MTPRETGRMTGRLTQETQERRPVLGPDDEEIPIT
jgi:hypothetical protein